MEEQNNALPQAPAGNTPEPPVTEIKPEGTVSPQEPIPAASEGTTAPAAPPESVETVSAPAAVPPAEAEVSPVSSSDVPPANSVVENATVPEPTPELPPVDSTPPVQSVDAVIPAPVNDVQVAQSPVVSATPVSASAPTVTPSSAPSGGHHMHMSPKIPKFSRKSLGIALMLFALLFLVGSSVYFALGQQSAKKELAELKERVALMDQNEHDLPEGAIKLSECVPNMGFHYMEQGADPKFGPILLVSTKGKVIGYEYMFNDSMLTEIPDAGIPLEVLLTDGPVLLKDWQYNSIDFSRATAGHPGFEEDHYDVHLYTVDPEEQKRACE